MGVMEIGEEGQKVRKIKPDNLYDVLFNTVGNLKGNTQKKLVITGENFNILENKGGNIQFQE